VAAPQADLARENERLRLENHVLREEREVLKKATQLVCPNCEGQMRPMLSKFAQLSVPLVLTTDRLFNMALLFAVRSTPES
jgi:hypothetical protein